MASLKVFRWTGLDKFRTILLRICGGWLHWCPECTIEFSWINGYAESSATLKVRDLSDIYYGLGHFRILVNGEVAKSYLTNKTSLIWIHQRIVRQDGVSSCRVFQETSQWNIKYYRMREQDEKMIKRESQPFLHFTPVWN